MECFSKRKWDNVVLGEIGPPRSKEGSEKMAIRGCKTTWCERLNSSLECSQRGRVRDTSFSAMTFPTSTQTVPEVGLGGSEKK